MKQADIVRLILAERERVLAYIDAIVRDYSLAEDIFQETAMLLVTRRDTLQNEQHVKGWLRLTARNLSFKAMRDRARQPVALDQTVIEALDPHWDAVESDNVNEKLEALRKCIGGLSAYGREILRQRYGRGIVGDELASALGRTQVAVRRALSRVHKALAECISKQVRQIRAEAN